MFRKKYSLVVFENVNLVKLFDNNLHLTVDHGYMQV